MTDETTKSPSSKTTRQPSFSPEALQAVIDKAVSEALAKQAATFAVATAKPATNGKTAKQLANETATVRAFKKAGFGTVVPRIDVLTFGLWAAKGFRPVEGSKAIKCGGLRLFHRSQVRELTAQEKAEPKAAAKPAKGAKVIAISGEASPPSQ